MTVHTTRTTLAVTASVLLLGLVGCSPATGGEPEPSTGGETTAAASDPLHIDKPKNLKAVADPCQLLTSAQVQQLKAGTPAPGQSEWGQTSCTWRNQELRIDISPDTVQGQGLRWMAKTAGDNGKPNANVNGYPGVRYGVSRGSCGTYVGTSDKDLFLVYFQTGSEGSRNPEYADPCAMSDKIAGMVLENLPQA
ncbi:DUF3558 domain-containing protein [Saccharopolyspora sp. ASAGF58]|uniref:DUF3558 domain-containing protein n=1 Tax=Saccharopolyspora sp. ASAGF58 TaxID=2719023 RepID=UPI00143FCB7C|nr:DUF3558 domain-containing protein [Saccharopolyspora sp. ASAGF58]QIZ34289.1 DUF3558 domain-containing protein [Saccharopolyspora sp. ASAGF58]